MLLQQGINSIDGSYFKEIPCTFVTEFWKITHMGVSETIRTSELPFRAESYVLKISRLIL